MINRTHEECAECAKERIDSPECDGHIAGPSPCSKFEKLDDRYLTYIINTSVTWVCPKCKEEYREVMDENGRGQVWCLTCDIIFELSEKVVCKTELQEIKPGDDGW